MRNNKFTIISILTAIAMVGLAIMLKPVPPTTVNVPTPAFGDNALPTLGDIGSTHEHATLFIFVNDALLGFSADTYMGHSGEVHFHDNNGITIHKHTTGITVPLFLATLGIKMTQNCLVLDTAETFCNDEEKKLRLIVNGSEVQDFISYEISDEDKILVNFGSDSDTDLGFKVNNTPSVPQDILDGISE